jgi:ribose transport system permease protein
MNAQSDDGNVTESPMELKGESLSRGVFSHRSLSMLSPVLLALLLFGIGVAVVSDFASRDNIDSILVLATFLGICSAGQTLVIILGGIDLSVASTIGMGEVVTSVEYSRGMPLWQIFLILLVAGVVIGVLNGGISSYFHVHPLIVSLGVGFVISGGILIWTNGASAQGVSPPVLSSMTSLRSTIGPIPVPPVLLVWLAVAVIMIAIQRRSRLGRELYALGSNAEAAGLALARRKTVWVFAYSLSALAGLLAGVLLSGFAGGADFSAGAPYLFYSIAAVVVGGTSLLGGSGGYGRTIIGSIVIIEMTTILVAAGLSSSLQETMLGIFIILVVAAVGREVHVRTRV